MDLRSSGPNFIECAFAAHAALDEPFRLCGDGPGPMLGWTAESGVYQDQELPFAFRDTRIC